MNAIKKWLRNWLGIETEQPKRSVLAEVFEINWTDRDALWLRETMNSDPGIKFRMKLNNLNAGICQQAAFAATEEQRKELSAVAKALSAITSELTTAAQGSNPTQESLSTYGVLGAEGMTEDDIQNAFKRMAAGERYDGADVLGVR